MHILKYLFPCITLLFFITTVVHAKYKKEVQKIVPKILENIQKIKKMNIENQEYSRKLSTKESIVINNEQLNKNISHIEKMGV